MKQETTAGKILVELIELGIVTEENEWVVYNYLLQAYAVGYDTGTKARSHQKPIAQYTLEGKPIEIYASAAEASRVTKVDHSDISRCAVGKAHTAGGYKWEYINSKNPTGSETITVGSVKPKSTHPKPEIHASKTGLVPPSQ